MPDVRIGCCDTAKLNSAKTDLASPGPFMILLGSSMGILISGWKKMQVSVCHRGNAIRGAGIINIFVFI